MTTKNSNNNSNSADNVENAQSNLVAGQTGDTSESCPSNRPRRPYRGGPYRNETPSRSTLWRRSRRPGPGQRGADRRPRRRGPEHGNWVHGQAQTRNMGSPEYTAWQEGVHTRCNFRCVLTGETTDLVCHHLNGWNVAPEERYLVANGVVLTRTVHNQFHRIFGAGNNTLGQFIEFVNNYYNGQCSITLDGNHDPSLTTEYFMNARATRAQKLGN
uniref:Putative HNH homing endonuclease n=1 Tax=Chlorogonium capillatum TaxID=71743 RepID=A0A0S2ICT6_9CHLO|nr:putative HNH homing endonuclease [Chlorogonium capillatum]